MKNKALSKFEDVNEFVTYGGVYHVPLQPVSPFSVDDIIARESQLHPEPVCPTYEETSDAGESMAIKIDAEAIKQYPELEKPWNEYLALKQEHEVAINMALSDLYVLEGTPASWQPPEEWVVERKRRYGDLVPTSVDELKIHWMRREVLRRPSDIGEFTRSVAELSEMTPARLQAVEDSFRSEVGEQGRQDAE
jgi:hypothetical protein